jgi:hypothetical protein
MLLRSQDKCVGPYSLEPPALRAHPASLQKIQSVLFSLAFTVTAGVKCCL